MVTKQKKTSMPGATQPVRFYKIVALTFLCITILLLGLIVFMSSKRATITILTKPEPLETSFTVDVTNGTSDGIWQTVTTTEMTMSKTFNPKGTRVEEGIAKGNVTLYNDSATAQPLVATTRLLTPEGILFRLKNSVTVPANGSIVTEVYADQKGASSDIGASDFSIPGLPEARRKEVYAKSTDKMSGGMSSIGVVNATDLARAETELKEHLDALAQTNLKTLYPDATFAFKVIDTQFSSDTELGTETTAFVVTAKAQVTAVFYNAKSLAELAQENLKKQIVDSNEIVHETESIPEVAIDGVDIAAQKATVTVTYDGLVSLDQNSKNLDKGIFYGKSEDEVRRYVLSLDHVSGVEVKFKPIWNKSVPHVADHVDLKVRQVE